MAAPNNPRFVTIMMDLGFRSNPNLHRAQKRPIQSADRSTATVGGVDQSFSKDLVRSGSMMFCDRNEKDDDGGMPKVSGVWLPTRVLQKKRNSLH